MASRFQVRYNPAHKYWPARVSGRAPTLALKAVSVGESVFKLGINKDCSFERTYSIYGKCMYFILVVTADFSARVGALPNTRAGQDL